MAEIVEATDPPVGTVLEGKGGERFPMRGAQMYCSLAPRRIGGKEHTVQRKKKRAEKQKAAAEQLRREMSIQAREGKGAQLYMQLLEKGLRKIVRGPRPKSNYVRRDKSAFRRYDEYVEREVHKLQKSVDKEVEAHLDKRREEEGIDSDDSDWEFESDDEEEEEEGEKDDDDAQFERTLTPTERAMEMALTGEDYWAQQRSAKYWARARKVAHAKEQMKDL